MKKADFLETLRRAIKFQAKPQSVACRCAGCCNGKQKRQGKIVNAVLK